jgi:hypothetical protein
MIGRKDQWIGIGIEYIDVPGQRGRKFSDLLSSADLKVVIQ